MVSAILTWLSFGVTLALLVLTLLPLIRTGHWVARVCDFPRLQILGLCLIPLALLAVSVMLGSWGYVHTVLVVTIAAMAIWQSWRIVHYTRFWPCDVPDHVASGQSLELMIVNLDFENHEKDAVLGVLQKTPVDVLLLIEIDEAWSEALNPLRETYPQEEGAVRGDGLGLLVMSRLGFKDSETRHLVNDDRASVRCQIRVGTELVEINALHPRPPGLKASEKDERHNSRERDAELVLIAKEIQEAGPMHRLVVGDLNDVAWSHTTRLFRRLSGLKDPRIGRSYLSTYHARYPLLRYPLDHIFVSDEIGVSRLERIRVPGSDHFGIIATVEIPRAEKPENTNGEEATSEDEHEASRIVEEAKDE